MQWRIKNPKLRDPVSDTPRKGLQRIRSAVRNKTWPLSGRGATLRFKKSGFR